MSETTIRWVNGKTFIGIDFDASLGGSLSAGGRGGSKAFGYAIDRGGDLFGGGCGGNPGEEAHDARISRNQFQRRTGSRPALDLSEDPFALQSERQGLDGKSGGASHPSFGGEVLFGHQYDPGYSMIVSDYEILVA